MLYGVIIGLLSLAGVVYGFTSSIAWSIAATIMGALVTALVQVFVYIIFFPEKAEKLASLVAKCVVTITGRAKKRQVALDLQSKINTCARSVDNETAGLMPYRLQIDWASPDTRGTFLDNDTVVVRLDYEPNPERNLVIAIMAFLSRALLAVERRYIDNTLSRSLELTMAKSMVDSIGSRGAATYMLENIIEPDCTKDQGVAEDCEVLTRMHMRGHLTRVLLRGLMDLARKAMPGFPNPSVRAQSRQIFSFMRTLSERQKGEIVPLVLKTELLKFQIVLVAKKDTRDTFDIWPYVERVRMAFASGNERVFILAIGIQNVDIAKRAFRKLVENEQAKLIDMQEYEVSDSETYGPAPAICIECKSMQKAVLEKLRRAFSKHVQQVNDGLVEIVAFGRIPGERCKVAVRSVKGRQSSRS
ncbi:MAG: hypothetical protein IBX64_04500 [Actinobacteria bacterium]|nr:hypothetical protein [Actinomycetota bacterium]